MLGQKIRDRSARIVVVGLGYVGLPLATAFARVGFHVTGIDVDSGKVDKVNAGKSYITDVDGSTLANLVKGGKLSATCSYEQVRNADAIIISVPTPYLSNKSPDVSFIIAASKSIAAFLHAGQLVILQSTTYPGTTEEEVLPILEAHSGLTAGRDFYLAFCPERVNPGDRQFTLQSTAKVVGGLTTASASFASMLMGTLGAPVHTVSSPRAAEMTKLLENIYRNVNIALVNEMAMLAERMGIDFWEVIEAASTKPFGFMPFYPGAGVGGHCIPVDPYYLSWKAREYDFYTKFIELAADVNQNMPYHAVSRLVEALNSRGKPLAGAAVMVLGVAFKKGIDDARNSAAVRILELLLEGGAQIQYHDPYVPRIEIRKGLFQLAKVTLNSEPLTDQALSSTDCVMIVTGHDTYDYPHIVKESKLVVDCCNATRSRASHVFTLGVGRRAGRNHHETCSPSIAACPEMNHCSQHAKPSKLVT